MNRTVRAAAVCSVALLILFTLFLPTPVAFSFRLGDSPHGIPVWACYFAMTFGEWPYLQTRALGVVVLHVLFVISMSLVVTRLVQKKKRNRRVSQNGARGESKSPKNDE